MTKWFGWLAIAVVALSLQAGCSSHGDEGNGAPPPGLDLSTTKTSTGGKYVVDLRRPGQPTRVNKLESWQIVVRTPAGAPVPGASIRFGGGMPQHDHGFPTQPRVVPDPASGAASGDYQLQGMKFSMPGWWVIRLDIDAPGGTDDITFNVVLPPSAS
ncbi:FixH family protein [Cupriavidus consociatus]|uniref:FixH family protein n=1 Tax=Cupriavidus consociatus TaxID=2821357 RepID=UPI001FD7D8B5|nr:MULTISPECIES: FixH family protein [unclassified Cupriavidus]MDK2660799.1 FixH family protein [Cupriavidus sp. LEh21]